MGPLGLGSPRFQNGPSPVPAVLCIATTAFVLPGSHRGEFIRPGRRLPDAWVLVLPATLLPAIAPKETGGSPEFPSYPCKHMPRSQTPVVSRPLALARTGLLPSGSSIPSALGPVARPYPAVHHYTVFGVQ